MKYITTILLLCCICNISNAQSKTIIGTIIHAENKQPLNGVTIQVNKRITTTNLQGNFSIVADSFPVQLKASYTGFITSITQITSQTSITIALLPVTQQLDSVVVSTGYQQISKERSTGSVNTINNILYNRQVSTDIISRLEGLSTALLFDKRGSSDQLSVRGLSTVFADKSPLIVVDNFPYTGDIRSINPNDIENINILKDAAAAAIWGVRAANGVIVITTKKGRFNRPVQTEININTTIGEKPNLFYSPIISSSDFIDVEQFLFDRGFYTAQENAASRPSLSPVIETRIRKRDGLITALQADSIINSFRNYDIRNDYNNYLYSNTIKQQYALSFRGGGNNNAWALFTGYDFNKGTLSDTWKRINLRAENTTRIKNNLDAEMAIWFSETNTESGKPDPAAFTTAIGRGQYPYARLTNDNGNPVPILREYRLSFLQTAQNLGLPNWQYNPLEDYKYTSNTSKQNNILINTGLIYRISKSIQLSAKYRYENETRKSEALFTQPSYFARDFVNRFAQLGTDGKFKFPVPVGGMLDQFNSAIITQAVRLQSDINHKWKNNTINAIVGTEIRQQKSTVAANRTYGYNDDILTYTSVNYDSAFRLFSNNGVTSRIPDGKSFADIVNNYTSFYLNINYSLKNKYHFSASARRDGSNLFGINTNQKILPLWSLGAAWEISKETWYKKSVFPYLKLRATYGFNGNLDNSQTAFATINYLSSGNSFITSPYARITKLPNPDLRWEKTGILNLSADFETRNKTFWGSIEYYHKNTIDLLADAPVDPTIGWPSGTVKRNIGNLKGNGIDIEINAAISNQKIKWYSTILFSTNNNWLVKFDTTGFTATGLVTKSITVNPVLGKPVNALYSYNFAGLDNTGDPLGFENGGLSKNYLNLTTRATPSDLIYHGSATPTVFGTWRNTIGFKNLEFSFSVSYKFNYWFRTTSLNYTELFTQWKGHADFANRWQQPGDEAITTIPSMKYPAVANRESFYTYSSVLVEKGDNIRLQDINLNYTFNKINSKIIPFKTMQVYAYVNNIGLLWTANKKGLDPDYITRIPDSRTYSIGIRTNF